MSFPGLCRYTPDLKGKAPHWLVPLWAGAAVLHWVLNLMGFPSLAVNEIIQINHHPLVVSGGYLTLLLLHRLLQQPLLVPSAPEYMAHGTWFSPPLNCDCMWPIHCCPSHQSSVKCRVFGHLILFRAGIPSPPTRWRTRRKRKRNGILASILVRKEINILKQFLHTYIWVVWLLVKNLCVFQACFSGLTVSTYKSFLGKLSPHVPMPNLVHSQSLPFSEGRWDQRPRPSGRPCSVHIYTPILGTFISLFRSVRPCAEVFFRCLCWGLLMCVCWGEKTCRGFPHSDLVPSTFPLLALSSHPLPDCRVQKLPEPFLGASSIVRQSPTPTPAPVLTLLTLPKWDFMGKMQDGGVSAFSDFRLLLILLQ